MKTIKFSYTDAKGKLTIRTVVPLQEPNANLTALDISEIIDDEDTLKAFASEYDAIQTRLMEELTMLYDLYDLNHRLRSFKPNQMTGKEINAI